MSHENYNGVLHQLEQMGCVLRDKDKRLQIDTAKKVTCGKGGKFWYRLYTFRPEKSTRSFIVGTIGSYRTRQTEPVEWDKEGLSAETLERYRAEQAAARERDRVVAQQAAEEAALNAAQLWAKGSRTGKSAYLERKGVEPESCRFMPDGSILVPLLRYDLPRDQALKAVQRIYPGPRFDSRTGDELPQKVFTKGFAKTGCAVRLGTATEPPALVLVSEGYATGLTIRMGTERRLLVYVALDAYNLEFVVQLLREHVHPDAFILICADDDWKSADHEGPNPGMRRARKAAKVTERCEVTAPVFDPATRQLKDTDFNDLHQRQGLATVARQLGVVVKAIMQGVGRG